MPYKSEKIKLSPEQDRRRKLRDDQRKEIRRLYLTGYYSLQQLANEYGVSKKTILLIVNPDSKKKNDHHIKCNWKKYQQSKEKRAKTQREHRHYKQKLYKSGLLVRDNEKSLDNN